MILLLVECSEVSLGSEAPTGVTQTDFMAPFLWAFAGVLTDFHRTPSKNKSLHRSATFQHATFTHLLDGRPAGTGRHSVYGPFQEIEDLQTSFFFRAKEMLKMGRTVSGAQLLQVTQLPMQHKSVVLGISRSITTSLFIVHHHELIIKSLVSF